MVERSTRTGREMKRKKKTKKKRESGTDGGGERGKKSERSKGERGSQLDLFFTTESKNKQKNCCLRIFSSPNIIKAVDGIYLSVARWHRAAKFCLSPHSSVLQSGRDEH